MYGVLFYLQFHYSCLLNLYFYSNKCITIPNLVVSINKVYMY